MKILVIGSGGREHALIWKISQSKLCDKIFCAPGNGGIADDAECVDIVPEQIPELVEFARKEKIDFTVVGPEASLSLGIVDEFKNHNLEIFGPTKTAARLESSKVFAKEFMKRYSIPTADFKVFVSPEKARDFVTQRGVPCVLKVDGLAQGKGVVVAETLEQANDAISAMMEEKSFGSAGQTLLIEDMLHGEEASILILTDSQEFIPLATSQDHKRVFDCDQGPNTGGMGAYSPALAVKPDIWKAIEEKIIKPILKGFIQEKIVYRGVLYIGIMITENGPFVLEFNARFGDPETQAILPRLSSDLLEVLLATSRSRLASFSSKGGLLWKKESCVCVVCASGGYPGAYERNKEIFGLEAVKRIPNLFVFHAGTKAIRIAEKKTQYFTNGGRVLGVTGLGNSISDAAGYVYQAVSGIRFQGMHYRRDIAAKAF